MSSMERNKGKLIPVTESLGSIAERLVPDENLGGDYKNKLEALMDDFNWYGEGAGLQLIHDKVYKVEFEVRCDTDCYDFADVVSDPLTGVIDFHTMHYNGGASWTEVVEDKLNGEE